MQDSGINTLRRIDDSVELVLDGLESTEVVYHSISDEEQKRLKRPLKRSEHTYFEYAGRIDSEDEYGVMKSSLKKGEHVAIEAVFEIPESDGFYEEIVEVLWHLSSASGARWSMPARTKSFVHYKVEDGCVQLVDSETFNANVFPKKKYYGQKHGKRILMNDVEGYWEDTTQPMAEPTADDFKQVIIDEEVNDEGSRRQDSNAVKGAGPFLNLTLCVRIRFRDDYDAIPTDTTGMQWWRPRGDRALHNFTGIRFEVWDRDEESPDDYIKTGNLNFSADGNYGCFAISWDQGGGELYPDVYIRTEYEVWDTAASATPVHMAEYCSSETDCDSGVTWRSSYIEDFGKTQTKAYMGRNFGSYSSPINKIAIVMNAMQKGFSRSHGQFMTDDIKVHFPGDSTSCDGLDSISIREGDYWSWTTPTHEFGHAYHHQLLRAITLNYPIYCVNHTFYSAIDEHCATIEGWAEFVSSSCWYYQCAGVQPRVVLGRVELVDIENDMIHPACTDNAKTEGMMCKAFWDMYDTQVDTDEPVSDTASVHIAWWQMAAIWTLFPVGDGDGENTEPTMNMIDYRNNALQLSQDSYDDAWAALQQNDGDCQTE